MIYFPSIAYAQRKTAICKLGLHPTRLGKGRHLHLSMRSHLTDVVKFSGGKLKKLLQAKSNQALTIESLKALMISFPLLIFSFHFFFPPSLSLSNFAIFTPLGLPAAASTTLWHLPAA